jgi:hypothetical protein
MHTQRTSVSRSYLSCDARWPSELTADAGYPRIDADLEMSDFLKQFTALFWACWQQDPAISEIVQDAGEEARIAVNERTATLILQRRNNTPNLKC